jgi:hypothetical protein
MTARAPLDVARDFIQALTLPVWQAAAVVRWLEGRVENLPKPHEPTPVKAALTYGDCVSQEILLTALRAHFPWMSIDAEEDTPTARAFASNTSEYRVVIDPIDGTLRYLQRDGLYAILVGLEREDRVEAALVAIPQADLMLRAVRGAGAEIAFGGGPFSRAELGGRGNRLLVSYDLPRRTVERLERRDLELLTAAGGAIGVSPLLVGTRGGVRLSAEASGLSRRTWVSGLVAREAGAVIEALDGPLAETYTPGVKGVLVAADAAEVERLRKALED